MYVTSYEKGTIWDCLFVVIRSMWYVPCNMYCYNSVIRSMFVAIYTDTSILTITLVESKLDIVMMLFHTIIFPK